MSVEQDYEELTQSYSNSEVLAEMQRHSNWEDVNSPDITVEFSDPDANADLYLPQMVYVAEQFLPVPIEDCELGDYREFDGVGETVTADMSYQGQNILFHTSNEAGVLDDAHIDKPAVEPRNYVKLVDGDTVIYGHFDEFSSLGKQQVRVFEDGHLKRNAVMNDGSLVRPGDVNDDIEAELSATWNDIARTEV